MLLDVVEGAEVDQREAHGRPSLEVLQRAFPLEVSGGGQVFAALDDKFQPDRRGLDASEDERARERERELAVSASELERTRARLAEAQAALALAREREQITASSFRALAERARGEFASCPQCQKPLRGYDLLVSGHCPQCARPITALLLPRPQTGAPDRDAYLALLGALGGLVGLALATTSGGAG